MYHVQYLEYLQAKDILKWKQTGMIQSHVSALVLLD